MSGLAINDAGDVLVYDGQQWKSAPMAMNDAGEKAVYDGGSWRPLADILGKAKGSKPQGRSDAAANAFGQGATFGFGDELAAGVRAAAPGLSNFMMRGPVLQRDESIGGSPTPQTVSTAPTMGGRYDEELARQRAQTRSNAEAYPTLTTGANIAGGLASTGLAAMAGLPVAPSMGPALGGNMVRMGLAGAAYGGAQGFGEGEGGLENRLRSAGMGATVGGGLGALTPAVGAGVRAAAESAPGQWVSRNVVAPVAQRVAGMFEGTPARSLSAAAPDGTQGITGPLTQFADTAADPARNGAIERLTTALQRSGMTREQIERRLAQVGPEAMLADLDPQLRTQARLAYTMPGDTRSHAETVLQSREAGRPDRMIAAFEGNEPPPPTFKLKGEGQAFDEYLRAVGGRAYQGDMAKAGLKQTPELMALYENPYVDAALKNVMDVEKKARIGRPDAPPASPVEIMHKVKQAIWDMGFDAASARPGPNASYYRDLGTDFVNKLKAANPALAQADREYSAAAKLPDFFDKGYSLLTTGRSDKAMNASSSALAEALAEADPLQRLSTRAGMTNAARDEVSGRNSLARSLALAKDVDPRTSREIGARLAQSYEPAQAREIGRVGSAEVTMDQTKRGIMGGSDTASKMADMFDNAGIRLSDGKPSLRWWETIKDIAAKATAPNESVRNQIGRMTLTRDAERNAEILRLAFEQLRKRQSGRPLAAALAGNAGSSLSGAP